MGKWRARNVSRELLERAREVLSHFALVGRTEDHDAFVEQLNILLGVSRNSVPPVKNRTPKDKHYALSDEDMEYARSKNAFDRELYHGFCGSSSAVAGERAYSAKPRVAAPLPCDGISSP